MKKPNKYEDVRINRVPVARDELRQIALDLRARGDAPAASAIIEVIDGLLYRQGTGKPVARATANKITSKIVANVLAHYQNNKHASLRSIGRIHGIDGGRVNEIISGKRTVADPSMSRFTK